MSIVIKGVNAPNNCYDCINSSDGEPFELLSNCPTFGDLCEGKITTNELPKDKRSDFCPVKQLPTPHGRLIDADRFLDWLKEFHPNDVVIMSGVKNARTVIEAEGVNE